MAGFPVLVLVGALILWVVIQVVRAQQNEVNDANKNRRNPFDGNRPNNNPEANRTADKSSANDIDRFLQEIDRLRQRAGKPKEEEKQQPKPPAPQPAQAAQTSSPPRPKTPAPKPQQAPPPPKPRPAPRPEPVSMPAAPPQAPPTPPTPGSSPPPIPNQAERKFAEFSAPPVLTSGSLVGSAPAQLTKQAVSPVIEMIRSLLKQPRGVTAALIIKEILDPPPSSKR
jgi:hypothetical protein